MYHGITYFEGKSFRGFQRCLQNLESIYSQNCMIIASSPFGYYLLISKLIHCLNKIFGNPQNFISLTISYPMVVCSKPFFSDNSVITDLEVYNSLNVSCTELGV